MCAACEATSICAAFEAEAASLGVARTRVGVGVGPSSMLGNPGCTATSAGERLSRGAGDARLAVAGVSFEAPLRKSVLKNV